MTLMINSPLNSFFKLLKKSLSNPTGRSAYLDDLEQRLRRCENGGRLNAKVVFEICVKTMAGGHSCVDLVTFSLLSQFSYSLSAQVLLKVWRATDKSKGRSRTQRLKISYVFLGGDPFSLSLNGSLAALTDACKHIGHDLFAEEDVAFSNPRERRAYAKALARVNRE